MAPAQSLSPVANLAPAILIEYWILFVVSSALLGLRCYVRQRIVKSWGWDDITIILSWVLLLGGLALIHIQISHGLGGGDLARLQQQALEIKKVNLAYQIINVICTLLTKISISIFILRIKSDKIIRHALAVLMTLMTLASIQAVLVLCLACIPLSKFWDPARPGSCLAMTTVYSSSYVQSAFAIVTDLCLTASPIIILWHVELDLKKKAGICSLTSLGLVATISNALRNVYLPAVTSPGFIMQYESLDNWTEQTARRFVAATGPLVILSILEMTSGVIAACIPACMPFFRRKALQRRFSTTLSCHTKDTKDTSTTTVEFPVSTPESASEILDLKSDDRSGVSHPVSTMSELETAACPFKELEGDLPKLPPLYHLK